MNIAILGYGTIGKGVYKIVGKNPLIKVVKILERKERIDESMKDLFTSNIDEIINDKSIDLVVEVLGGYDFAKKAIIDCLEHHKHVVTANKEVISKDIDILIDIARINHVTILYEASVGGGIPIIKNLKELTYVSKITKITGILNGTTNFILTRMFEGMDYDEALKLAQEKGFAESDPTADVEGYDMMRKIAILSDLAFKTYVDINKIKHQGITKITKEDIKKAKANNEIIKYVCEAYLTEDNKLDISVMPEAYPNNHFFSNVNDEYNAIILETYPNDTLMFIGKGAGSLPTASAIVSDIMDIMNKKDIQTYKKQFKYEIV